MDQVRPTCRGMVVEHLRARLVRRGAAPIAVGLGKGPSVRISRGPSRATECSPRPAWSGKGGARSGPVGGGAAVGGVRPGVPASEVRVGQRAASQTGAAARQLRDGADGARILFRARL